MKKWVLIIAVANIVIAGISFPLLASINMLSSATVAYSLMAVFMSGHALGIALVGKYLFRCKCGRVQFWLNTTLPAFMFCFIGVLVVFFLVHTYFFYAAATITFWALGYSLVLFVLTGITQLFINKTVKTNSQ